MLMSQSFSELKSLLRAGKSVSVSADDYAAYDLIRLAGVAHEGNAKLTITDSVFLTKEKVAAIIEEGKGSVSFDRDVTKPEVVRVPQSDDYDEDEDDEGFDFDDDDEDEEEI